MGTQIKLAMMATAIAMTFTSAQAATLRVGMQDDPDALDPATSGTYAGRIVFAAMCDKLVDIDAKLGIVPQLATAWTWNAEGTEVTLTLRDGVKFQDGTPFNAEAVKFNIERMKSLKDSKRKGELAPIDSVIIVDANHVSFKLKSAFAPLLAVLSDRAGMMVSPTAAAEGKEFSANPVCAGPFKYKERRARDVISLEKFDGYWNAAAIGYDAVQYLYIPDSTVRLSRLQAGDLEIAERIAPTDLAAVRSSKALALHTSPGLAVSHLMINVGNGEKAGAIGKDAKLRQALELSIDRNVINKVAFAGEFVADNQMIPPSSIFYDKSKPAPARNIEKAKALIAEAGGAAPVVEITYENSLADGRVAQIIQSMASEAGFKIELVPLETASAVERYLAGNFQAYIGNWSGRADPDPTLFSFFGKEGSQNVNKYSNPDMDKTLGEARASADEEQRKALYAKATDIYLRDLPTIPLYHPNWFYASRANVDGITIFPDGLLRLTDVKPAK
ncbi:peptide/nickel transport system substrate-binding protein [Neorhizobium galegae]|uniref:ABC transporter substrate-binding protein n=1 Tax=Neorhizobium galegae TaxID=399 RepID=UPI001AE20447|nr:ABC transporter substrate-binding protein [Neorhizobium galegae]MBP2551132.1 peptide/nickel transport system substrate-binding protein [Neorhizobium galegae]